MIEGDTITFGMDGMIHDAKILKIDYVKKKIRLEIEIVDTHEEDE